MASTSSHTTNGVKPNSAATNGVAPSPSIDYSKYLSNAAKVRPPSAIRSLFPAELIPGMISLLAGKPNPSTFPLASLSLSLKAGAEGASSDPSIPTTLTVQGADLDAALQYGATAGLPRLNAWLTQFMSRIHGREIVTQGGEKDGKDGLSSWRITLGIGSQDLLTKTFEALVNPGDSVLVESPAYAGILPSLQMLHARIFEASTDAEGVSATALDTLLSNWTTDPATSTAPFPKFIYTVPTGSNPAGTTASDQRKREVLDVIRRHGLLLLEDDPYYFLGFDGLGQDPVTRTRGRSYWSLENEGREQWGTGRVLRFESFSKILSAGLRLGHCTGPNALIDAIDLDTASRNLQTAGPSQAITLALLEHWGPEGFLRHADSVASFYMRRRDNFEAKAHKHLEGVAEWVTPVAGMFLWLKLRLPPSNASDSSSSAPADEGDSFELISTKAKAAGVLAVPGMAFMPSGGKTCYVRTSFSIIPEEEVDEAFRRLRKVVLGAWEEAGRPLALEQ